MQQPHASALTLAHSCSHPLGPTTAWGRQAAFMKIWSGFMQSQGLSDKIPKPGFANFDLYTLFVKVLNAGGSASVTEQKKWAEIGRSFHPRPTMTDLSHKTKNIFMKKLHAMEEAYARGEVDLSVVLEKILGVTDSGLHDGALANSHKRQHTQASEETQTHDVDPSVTTQEAPIKSTTSNWMKPVADGPQVRSRRLLLVSDLFQVLMITRA